MKDKCIVFDLDDTLVYEIDFLKSAYKNIAKNLQNNPYKIMLKKYFNGENVFQYLVDEYNLNKEDLLKEYRLHIPEIQLINGAKKLLDFCKKQNYFLGIITDGRSITQRNKLHALQISDFFDKIVISEEIGSEKPSLNNYEMFHQYNAKEYWYIGDNVKKDFVTPNSLGWKTICLLNQGNNIHPQNFKTYPAEYQPLYKVNALMEIIKIIE